MVQTHQAIASTLDYLASHYQEKPSLSFLADRAGFEPTYFQKLFTSYVGISPKKIIMYMHFRRARELLCEGHSTLDTAYQAGLSSPSRLHDLFVNCIAVTPGDMKQKGIGQEVSYGMHPSPLGNILVACTDKGICYLGFIVDEKPEIPLARMKAALPAANFNENHKKSKSIAKQVIRIWQGKGEESRKINLCLHGTNLQLQVWQALLKIPCGHTVSYKGLATYLGRPGASRAVGNAVGANPVSLLIPCHRVILSTGIVDNYGWGTSRKKIILACENKDLTKDS